jgi:hypothetical protein
VMSKKTSTKNISQVNQQGESSSLGGGMGKNIVMNVGTILHNNIMSLNNSKYFAGIVMILLNVGSKFVPISFSKSLEEYLKNGLSKQMLVFAMAWMGTRDIYTALGLTILFTIFSEYIFNEESRLCIIPDKYKMMNKETFSNSDVPLSDADITSAIVTLEKARKIKNECAKTKEQHQSTDGAKSMGNIYNSQ